MWEWLCEEGNDLSGKLGAAEKLENAFLGGCCCFFTSAAADSPPWEKESEERLELCVPRRLRREGASAFLFFFFLHWSLSFFLPLFPRVVVVAAAAAADRPLSQQGSVRNVVRSMSQVRSELLPPPSRSDSPNGVPPAAAAAAPRPAPSLPTSSSPNTGKSGNPEACAWVGV